MGRQVKTAAQASSAYVNGMAGAGAKYSAGIDRVQVSPTQLAASDQAMQKYVAGVQASVSSGRRAAALGKVSLDQWKSAAKQKGAARIGTVSDLQKQRQSAAAQAWQGIWQQQSDAAAAVGGGKDIGTAMAKVQAALQIAMANKGKTGS